MRSFCGLASLVPSERGKNLTQICSRAVPTPPRCCASRGYGGNVSIGGTANSAILPSMSQILDTPILERMLAPVTKSLNVDAAKKLVRLKADAKVQARVAILARKCNEGELTPKELAEYDRYIAFADFVAILQAKARLLLAKKS